MSGRIIVIKESETGRNEEFKDTKTGQIMSREVFVEKIENREYTKYYIKNINGIKIPCSKPDGNKNNNLG